MQLLFAGAGVQVGSGFGREPKENVPLKLLLIWSRSFVARILPPNFQACLP